jgi:hypothetical protein
MRKLKQLKEENCKLKHVVTLDNRALKDPSACGTSKSRGVCDVRVLSERAACLQANEVGTIHAPVSVTESGTRCRTAPAIEGVGGAADAGWLSMAYGDAGAIRNAGQP